MKKIRIKEVKRSQTVISNGTTLTVVTRHMGNGKWELYVENSYGLKSIWTEFFDSAKSAMRAGIRAIKTEGFESFCDNDVYEFILKK